MNSPLYVVMADQMPEAIRANLDDAIQVMHQIADQYLEIHTGAKKHIIEGTGLPSISITRNGRRIAGTHILAIDNIGTITIK